VDEATRISNAVLAGSQWQMAESDVRPALRPHVRALVGYEERADGPRSRRQLPGTSVVLLFEIGTPMKVGLGDAAAGLDAHPGGYAVGLGERFATTRHAGHQRGIQVDLSPTGARRFFGRPLGELSGLVVPLTELIPRVSELAARLEGLTTWDARLGLVETLLARRILGASVDTARVDWALDRIRQSGGRVAISELARELGHSRKHLVHLFRDHAGASPKLFAQLVRYERVLAQARADCDAAWADLALGHGYSDQAHLARELRRFTGQTPRALRARPSTNEAPDR
jgi:AraC-like DNA-binding protein